MTVIVRDLGFNALMARLRLMGVSGLTVGVHEDAGDVGGVSIAAVAAWQELGTPTIPARSFLRATLDNEKSQIENLVRDVTRRVIANRRRLPPRQALGIIGLDIQRRIQATIRRGISPPLVVRIGGTPLLNEGQLIQSIAFKVT